MWAGITFPGALSSGRFARFSPRYNVDGTIWILRLFVGQTPALQHNEQGDSQ